MKNILLMLLPLLGLVQTTKADTIDFWHVYYNHTKIQEFNQYGTHEIRLKLESLKSGDSITVKYFRDTPCSRCATYLTVEDEKHHVFVTSSGKGTFNPISFSINKLIELRKQGYMQTFEIFYFEGEIKSRSDKILIFRIILE
ncbi:hypothetical protein [Cytophaga aurantiaca]|uniref:hypothetical protein n=1 Tax=Cytophaga aurantiaca TaxID=29530 RepID=UPI0004777A20|nr:hypothetical protein [Cytophaga aurantiaca]